jgi:hypothetical protein
VFAVPVIDSTAIVLGGGQPPGEAFVTISSVRRDNNRRAMGEPSS